MNIIDIIALLIVLAAGFGVLNYFILRLPSTIGVLVIALFASFVVLALDAAFPEWKLGAEARRLVHDLHFSEALLEGMLGLLLFAGSLHVHLDDLKAQKWVIALTATVGVLIATAVVGTGFWLVAGIPLVVALVFGALIAPTDPVAVLGIFKQVKVTKSLETKIAGESLFNDGVGYVVFLILAGIAFPAEGMEEMSAGRIAYLFLLEAVGGALLGAVAGWVIFAVMKRIDDYSLEVLLTLALAMGVYALADILHVSGPIAAVVAGLLIGNAGVKHAMSEETREYVDAFWRLIDEILNAVLFLLIGLEVFAISVSENIALLGAASILLVLLGRLLAVSIPIALLSRIRTFSRGVIPIMTWGGLKGGISVALVLSLPESDYKPLLVSVTYIVVVFSILVQGLTVGRVVRKYAEAG